MKKTIVVVLALLCAAGFSFGAGGQEDGVAGSAIVNRAGFPIVTQPITLTAAIQHAWSCDWGEFDMFKEYEKLTGITIEWTTIPQANTVEKINLMLASGDYRDMILAPGLANRAAEAADEGMLLPLNDLIKEWAPQITKMFQEQPLMEQVGTMADGDADDEIPLAFWTAANGGIEEWITLFGAWGVVDTYMVDDNGRVRWDHRMKDTKKG
jgi:putative aldouronate transport system substrate-binding protein